ncbi:MAG TPA: ABC transporter permease [Candidatus Paceibacterota bacterium]|nr:ABC transporter permease [Candidatus Paceibacterota bacterium]
MKIYRIKAFIFRHWYEVVATIDRKVDIFFWPTIDLLGFGLLTAYIDKLEVGVGVAGAILGGIILWSLVYNIQRDISVSLLEEAWSRNLYNLFSSPLLISEVVIGALLMSFLKSIVTISLLLFIASGLFGFNLLALGWQVAFFLLNVFIFGWAFGFITSALIFRFGIRVQVLAWSLIAVIYPISGVIYPLDTLPPFLAFIAKLLPLSHIFEALRGIIINGTAPESSALLISLSLNIVFLSSGIALFVAGFNNAKKRGWLIHPS